MDMVETTRLNLKLLRVDKMALHQLAISEGESMSVIVRRILRKELRKQGFLPSVDPTVPELVQIHPSRSRIAKN